MTTTLDEIKEMLITLNNNVEKLNEKVEIISKKLDEEIYDECKKMGSHINFIEEVYDSMKFPLNYLCNTINSISGNDNQICDDNSK
jgi:ribosomal protein S8